MSGGEGVGERGSEEFRLFEFGEFETFASRVNTSLYNNIQS